LSRERISPERRGGGNLEILQEQNPRRDVQKDIPSQPLLKGEEVEIWRFFKGISSEDAIRKTVIVLPFFRTSALKKTSLIHNQFVV
jgi:hypothetical protein